LVTSSRGGQCCGLTATWFCPVSFEPPLLLVPLQHQTATADGIDESRAFGVSVLPDKAHEVAARFGIVAGATKFEGVPFQNGVCGSPLLLCAHASIDCTLWDRWRVGDHVAYVGRVVGAEASSVSHPLVHYQGTFLGLGLGPVGPGLSPVAGHAEDNVSSGLPKNELNVRPQARRRHTGPNDPPTRGEPHGA
jgi:flavin reductase (DIM6/NTAB) family NADH-FMN oxidoreductase RutF